MCSTAERLVRSVPRIVLVTAVLSTGLVALACGDKSPLPCGGQGSAACGNPLGPSVPVPTSYALRGIVTDVTGVPLAGAIVAVSRGMWALTPALPSVVTGADGRFETAPVVGEVVVHVSKDGYSTMRTTLTASENQLAFQMRRFAASTLVFTASPSCALPEEARSRDYAIQVEDWNGAIVVTVTDAEGVPYAAALGFSGVRDGNTVTFTLVDNPFAGEWAFVELITEPKLEFALSGTATGAMRETGMSTIFDGRVQVRSWTNTYTIAECRASDHRLEIVQ